MLRDIASLIKTVMELLPKSALTSKEVRVGRALYRIYCSFGNFIESGERFVATVNYHDAADQLFNACDDLQKKCDILLEALRDESVTKVVEVYVPNLKIAVTLVTGRMRRAHFILEEIIDSKSQERKPEQGDPKKVRQVFWLGGAPISELSYKLVEANYGPPYIQGSPKELQEFELLLAENRKIAEALRSFLSERFDITDLI